MRCAEHKYTIIKISVITIPVIIFFIFNLLTPVWWDDFVMACFFTRWYDTHTRLLSSFSEVIISTVNIYKTWHGRSVADFLNFLFMFFKDKTIYNIFNTLVYACFVFLIGFHAAGSIKKIKAYLFPFIHILLWFALPAWGQNFLWITGSCNYLWTSTVILLFLVPFRKKTDDETYTLNRALSVLWLVMGILAGWSMENSAAGVFFALIAYTARKVKKKEPLALFEVLGTPGFLFGMFMLIRARHNIFPDFQQLLENILDVSIDFFFQDALLIVIILFLMNELLRVRKQRVSCAVYGFFAACIGSVAAMVIPGSFGGRAIFMTQVFLIIILASLTLQIERNIPKRCAVAAAAAIIAVFIPSFYEGGKSITTSFLYAEAREHYILNEKAHGNLAVKVKTPVPVSDSHSGMWGAIDVLDDSAGAEYTTHNSAKAVWYGIQSLDGIQTAKKTNIMPVIKKFIKRGKVENLNLNDLLDMIYDTW